VARVLVYGGSTVYGLYDSKGGFAGRVKSEMMTRAEHGVRPSPEVYAFGFPGRTLPDIVAAFPGDAERYARGTTIGVFAVGASDHRIIQGRLEPKVPLDEFRSSLKGLGKQCAKYIIYPVFLGFPTIDDRYTQPFPPTKDNFNNDRLRIYTASVQSFVESRDGPGSFIDLVPPFDAAGNGRLTAHDRLHPNSIGHALIARLVIDEIDTILQTTDTSAGSRAGR
jgi:hypothetical protein